MANFPIPDEPNLDLLLRMFQTTDKGHADVFNAVCGQLIENDAFLNALANKMIEKAMISHVLDSANEGQVLGADVGGKITELIDAVDKKANDISSNFENLQDSIDMILPADILRMSVGYNDIALNSGWNALTIPLIRKLDSVGSVQVTIHSPSGTVRTLVETTSWTNDSVTVAIYNFDTGSASVGVMVQVWGT